MKKDHVQKLKFHLSLLIPLLAIVIFNTQLAYSESDNIKELDKNLNITQNIISHNSNIEKIDKNTVLINLYPQDFEIKNSQKTSQLLKIQDKKENFVSGTNQSTTISDEVKSQAKSDKDEKEYEKVKSQAKSDKDEERI